MLRPATALVAAALLVAGCGDSEDGTTDTQATAPQAPPPTTTQPPARTTPEREQQAAAPEPAKKKRRLEQAGYDEVIASGTAGVEPAPEAGLEFDLDGGGRVSVFVYASPADARTKGEEFDKYVRRYPEYFRVAVRGATTYVGMAEQPEKLDRAEFDEAVAAAEG